MFKIRKTKPSDAHELLNLRQTALWEPKCLIADPLAWNENIGDEIAAIRHYNRKNNAYFVAWSENQIIGYILFAGGEFLTNKHSGKMEIYVRREFRGQGVGTALIKELINWTKKNKIMRIELEVFAANKPAIAMYDKQGFKMEGVRKKAYLIGNKLADAIIMGKLIK